MTHNLNPIMNEFSDHYLCEESPDKMTMDALKELNIDEIRDFLQEESRVSNSRRLRIIDLIYVQMYHKNRARTLTCAYYLVPAHDQNFLIRRAIGYYYNCFNA